MRVNRIVSRIGRKIEGRDSFSMFSVTELAEGQDNGCIALTKEAADSNSAQSL